MASQARAFTRLVRCMHTTCRRQAITEFKMPAMSPTMSSGRISGWKIKEGDSFSAGDVLLSVETDKAEVDVEAQEDGVLGKIVLDEKESTINVGALIGLLAEQGDDISNIKVPEQSTSAQADKDSSASSSTESKSDTPAASTSEQKATEQTKTSSHTTSSPNTANAPGHQKDHKTPQHSMPLMPAAMRLLNEAGISDASKVKGTGFKGRLTKGDVLAYLGRIKTPQGTASKLEKMKEMVEAAPGKGGSGEAGKKQQEVILSGAEFRQWILSGLQKSEQQQKTKPTLVPTPVPIIGFDDIVEGYLSRRPPTMPRSSPVPPSAKASSGWDEIVGL